MNENLINDLRRELEKARTALAGTQAHLAAHAEMNAALHCASDRVMYSPLHAKVTAAIQQIEHALVRTEPTTPTVRHRGTDGTWASLAADLDRCQHGRHEGDTCGSCGGSSQGNPHMSHGRIIGYGLYAEPIVIPDRPMKSDPAAWRSGGGVEA